MAIRVKIDLRPQQMWAPYTVVQLGGKRQPVSSHWKCRRHRLRRGLCFSLLLHAPFTNTPAGWCADLIYPSKSLYSTTIIF